MSGSSPPAKSWYLVYTKPRQEQTAQQQLGRQGYPVYLPMTQRSRKRGNRRVPAIEPLFPRYLFIQLDTCRDDWGPIRSTVGVSALVRFGKEPANVPDVLIDLLRAQESTAGLHAWVEAEFRPGQPVRVVEGVLQGYEGIFVATSGRERVVVLLDILGRRVRARVAAGHLTSAD
mgnify:CR=1 FL=1